MPDEKYGEEVLACVRLQKNVSEPTEDEFRAMCKGKIAHFKIPRYWWVMKEFPMTVTGKTQKFKLREMAVEKFRLQAATVQ